MIVDDIDVKLLTDEIYDTNRKLIDFDYKRFVRIIQRINNKDPKSDDLKKIIKRDNFRKIPDGVYYCSLISDKTKMIPCLWFRNNDILTLSKVFFSCLDTVPEDAFSYFFVNLPLSNWHTYMAMSNTLYATGEDLDSAAKNLKLKIFDCYRSQILNMKKIGHKR